MFILLIPPLYDRKRDGRRAAFSILLEREKRRKKEGIYAKSKERDRHRASTTSISRSFTLERRGERNFEEGKSLSSFHPEGEKKRGGRRKKRKKPKAPARNYGVLILCIARSEKRKGKNCQRKTQHGCQSHSPPSPAEDGARTQRKRKRGGKKPGERKTLNPPLYLNAQNKRGGKKGKGEKKNQA